MVIRIIVSVAILVGVGARLQSLFRNQAAAPTVGMDRERIVEQISAMGSERSPGGAIEPFCFSADVAVILGVGPDGAPGRAGFDDNVNGLIDDPRETGAVGSDDFCLGPSDQGYDDVGADPGTVVISRGGFVRCESAADADRYRIKDLGWFVP